MPFCDTEAMQARHLGEISRGAGPLDPPGAHAVLILDQAGWPLSKDLVAPGHITLPPPPRPPELNPVENVRRFLRDNRLSNRVFRGRDDIVVHCGEISAKRSSIDQNPSCPAIVALHCRRDVE